MRGRARLESAPLCRYQKGMEHLPREHTDAPRRNRPASPAITRLRTTFAARPKPAWIPGDFGPQPDGRPPADDPFFSNANLADAAVLVAITDRPAPGILLTTRAADLAQHAGQVAFPGGRVEDGDRNLQEAALREAREEIGLPPDTVEVLGVQAPYHTGSGFLVHPVVGIVPPDLSYRIEPAEVANLFEVPVAFLFDRDNYETQSVFYKGRVRSYYSAMWEGHRIWGATAGMLLNLAMQLG